MAVNCFAVPILPGKTNDWKQAMAALSGARKAEFDEWNRRLGVTRHVVSLQETPGGDYVVVYAEGDDPAGTMEQLLTSDHPFEKWFVETILIGTHGVDPAQGAPPTNQVFIDWSA